MGFECLGGLGCLGSLDLGSLHLPSFSPFGGGGMVSRVREIIQGEDTRSLSDFSIRNEKMSGFR